MRRNLSSLVKFLVLAVISILITVFLFKTFHLISKIGTHEALISLHPRQGAFFNGPPKNVEGIKIDWHDYNYIALEELREGIGEHGVVAKLDDDESENQDKLFKQNGFNAILSDKISVNRSVPDIRHKDCRKKTYLKELPSVSVVVPFYNEHWSTLLRTVYSVLNRSPKELIVEIILVDDHSTKDFLKEPLDRYVDAHLPKVRVIRLPERAGLITARLAGAKLASGDVLIFLDSHTEANVNWLPPLLDPIATNYKVCVCPFIDVVAYDTFHYRAQDEGARGAFDWNFFYKRLPLLPESKKHPSDLFESPVMAGGLFAISARFFWELGGYDEGLDIWGGEQYELSFKIWQCGGKMYDAPCSRIGHIYRGYAPFGNPRKTDYLSKNYKRVAEVWMDEYKEYLYNRKPGKYSKIDAGDLTKQKAIREKLQCKSFKWFIEEVAFDLPLKYPPVEPPDFASGTVQSVENPTLCIDSLNQKKDKAVGLFSCAEDRKYPQSNQFWSLSWHKDIRNQATHCWDVPSGEKNAEVILYTCHGGQGNQLWRYDPDKEWIIQGRNNRCLESNGKTKKVYVNNCDENNPNMRWRWGVVDKSALANWDNVGVKEH